MEESTLKIILAVITIVPTMTTVIATIYQNSQRRKDKEEQREREERNVAKLSIQNMMLQDIVRTEVLGKMPENRDDIEFEYKRYRENGGNDIISRQVKEYETWIEQFKPQKSK